MITVNGNPITVNTNFISDISDWYNLKEIKIGNQIWSDKNFDYNPVNFNPSVYTRSAVNGYTKLAIEQMKQQGENDRKAAEMVNDNMKDLQNPMIDGGVL